MNQKISAVGIPYRLNGPENALDALSPQGAEGYRAYAVGDIHGRLDLLDRLLAKIEADIAARRRSKNRVIFLGDLINRGPQSAQVVEPLRTRASVSWRHRGEEPIADELRATR